MMSGSSFWVLWGPLIVAICFAGGTAFHLVRNSSIVARQTALTKKGV